MVIILEGAERTGKTTIARMLEKVGFIYIKDTVRISNGDPKKYTLDHTNARVDTAVNYISGLAKSGKNYVIDRLHITNAVCANEYRNQSGETYVKFFDEMLANMEGVRLYLFERDVDQKYVEEHPICKSVADLRKLKSSYKYLYDKSLIKEKAIFNIVKDNPEYILEYIMGECPFDECEDTWEAAIEEAEKEKVLASGVKTMDPKPTEYDIYIAAPFCTAKQIKSADKVRDMLNKYKYKCYMPVDAEVEFESMEEFASKVFEDRCKAIQNSKKVLVCADGIDARTAFEVGYAFSLGVPIIVYQEDESKDYLDEPICRMLEQIAKAKYKSFRELDSASFMAMSDMNR